MEYENLYFLEKNIEKKYIILSVDKTSKVIGYQINIINNELDDLLKITLKKSKESLDIFYDITNKITLEEYLKSKIIRVNEFSKILLSILKKIKQVDSYSFNNKNFVIMPDHIYFDNDIEDISLLYIPIEEYNGNNLEKQIKSLIKKLIVDVVNFESNKNDSFITDILNVLRDEDYSLLKLEKFLKIYREGNNREDLIEDKPHIKLEDAKETQVEKSDLVQNKKTLTENIKENDAIITQISEPSELLSPKTEMIMTDIEKPEKLENKYNSEMLEKQKKENNKLNVKYILSASIIQFIVIVLTVIELIFLNFTDDYVKYGILIGLWSVDIIISILLILNWIRNNNIYKLKKNRETTSLSFTNKNTEGIDCNFPNPKNDIKMSKREIVSQMAYSNGTRNEKFPFLLMNKNGMVEKIYINKSTFKIGRVPELVDYVSDNRAIGKIHAEIRNMNSKYYIMDLNSKNGTFINDKKLESNELYRIKEDDVIKMANSCYTFKVN
ncbi:MAG: DUF6382 domain-containing protein [Clostridium sp.]|nr:DUF6382 domain-containing protein [Clostridium sp.]